MKVIWIILKYVLHQDTKKGHLKAQESHSKLFLSWIYSWKHASCGKCGFQGFIYLIQIIHWFKIQIGLLNGSPSKVGMLVTIEIFFPFSTVVWPKRDSTSIITQIYLIQLRRYNFQKCGFNYFRNQMWKQILLRCWFAVCVNKLFSW